MTSMHTEDMDPNKDYDMELHHMHFTHGDTVQISVSVTNRAGSSTEAESNGFLVDLTDPVMYTLRDGYNSDKDLEYTVRFTPDLQRGGVCEVHSISYVFPVSIFESLFLVVKPKLVMFLYQGETFLNGCLK